MTLMDIFTIKYVDKETGYDWRSLVKLLLTNIAR